MRKLSAFTLILLLCYIWVAVLNICIVKAEPRTLVVPDDYISIQEAVDSSSVGDTVFVKSGTYYESVFINRAISLVGENPATTTIIGDYRLNGTVVLIRHNNVNITGFTVFHSSISLSIRGVHLLHVSHCAVFNNIFLGNGDGVWLYGSSENNITGNTIDGPSSLGGSCGITLNYSPNNWICENIVKDNDFGISLGSSQGNTLYNNTIMNNHSTGLVIGSDGNKITDNVVRDQEFGITLSGSNNILRGNKINNNTSNFNVEWRLNWNTSEFINDIDSSNTVEGKPIIYWVNEQDRKVPENAAFVALVNCTNITLENLKLSKNKQGIVLASTINSKITQNSIEVPDDGILVYSSFGNSITDNLVFNGGTGIHLASSFQNTITNNSITRRSTGIILDVSNGNIINRNTISGGSFGGIKLDGSKHNIISYNAIADCQMLALMFWNNSSENKFYLNSFINNAKNVEDYFHGFPEDIVFPTNIWDVDLMGNYWGDYNGKDDDRDGIGETPYVIDENNQDNYPLMAPVKWFDAGIWEWTRYYVDVVCNLTVSNFYFNPSEGTFIRFTVIDKNNTTCFCRVTIPKDLLYAEGNWTVRVDGYSVTPTINEDTNNSYIYFTYQHTVTPTVNEDISNPYFTYNHSKTIAIIGTTAIPEFPLWNLLPLFLVVTFSGIIIRKKLSRL